MFKKYPVYYLLHILLFFICKYKACWDNNKWKWRRNSRQNFQKSFYVGDDNLNAYDKFSEVSSESWKGTSKYLM